MQLTTAAGVLMLAMALPSAGSSCFMLYVLGCSIQVRERAAAAAAASADGSASGGGIAQLFGQVGSRPGTGSSTHATSSRATPLRPALENYIVSR